MVESVNLINTVESSSSILQGTAVNKCTYNDIKLDFNYTFYHKNTS